MLTEILTVGDELCRGEIVDTNSSWMAERLWDLDITVAWMTSCRDLAADIRAALSAATGRAELVLVSGGLGPTLDDLTVDVVSELAGVEPEYHLPSRARMEERYRKANFALTANNLRQVRVPAGARVYENPVGAAPGFEVGLGGTPVICLPGPPRELHGIFEGALIERLIELRESRGEKVERIARRTFRVFGAGESHIAAALEGLLDGAPSASLHFQVQFPETLVKVVVRDRDLEAARAELARIDADVRERLGKRVYGVDDDSLAAALGRELLARDATLATAESCTGGMIGSLVTEVPGSSVYFLGGAITYSNAEKVRQLGVSPETLAAHGAVSGECVAEMARGARERFGSDYAVAVSGIAGPGGSSESKPVGLVWLAVAGPGDQRLQKSFVWPMGRQPVRILAAHWAMALVMRAMGASEEQR